MLKIDYQIVLDSSGQAYLDAQGRLLEQGESAASFIQQKLSEAIGFDRLVAEVILEWITGGENFQAALDYLDKAERRAEQTPMGSPPPEAVATYLFQNFGDKVSALLGVYMVKLERELAPWKIRSAILYLGKLNDERSTDALIRLVSMTGDDTHRRLAVQSLVEIGDANVLKKLETALVPMEAARGALLLAVDQIRHKLGENPQ